MALEDRVRELTEDIEGADERAAQAARKRHARLTKPPGSLGWLEDAGIRLACIYGECPPPVPETPAVVVAVGDHGVLKRGVSPWPQEVTAAMVRNFCDGGAGGQRARKKASAPA